MEKILLTIEDEKHQTSMSITLPWDADIRKYIHAFKTILFAQTFTPESIDAFFTPEDEDVGDE